MRGRSAHHMISSLGEFIGEAQAQGELYQIEYYPGFIDSHGPDDIVFGEVFKLHSAEAFKTLDDYEGCSPKYPEPREYSRIIYPVTLLSGEPLPECWLYRYNWPVDKQAQILSGKF
jgi:gamma-glutamylcyclotransferase (GGCT)/AIG2-like uncharacterized protein YtfP